MKVQSFMTPDPQTVDAAASLDELLELMDRLDVRHVPVTQDGELLGVVSDRDVLAATGWMPERIAPARDGTTLRAEPRTAGDLVERGAVTVHPDDSMVMAAVEMYGRGIGCLPVENGRLRGILTEMDVLRAYLHAVKNNDLVGDIDPLVSQHMVHDLVTIEEDATLAEAEELLRSIHARHLPVTRGHDLAGIVSDRDLRRARGRGAGDEAPLDEIMTERIWTVGPDAHFTDAAVGMLDHKVSALPVVEQDRLVGILTLSDLLEKSFDVLRDAEPRQEL